MAERALRRPLADRVGLAAPYGFARSLLMYYGRPWRGRALRRHYAQFMGAGDLAFDVGAHVGNRTRAWRRLDARVVAIEPQPGFVSWLRWLFRNDTNVTVIEAALGARPGSASMFASRRTPTVSTLSAAWMERVRQVESFSRVAWDEERTVTLTTLDDLIERYGRPRFCKIDVEGYEADVLAGLSQPLPALSIEYVLAAHEVASAAVARLASLAPYRFNLSSGEDLRFIWPDWREADAVLSWLERHQGADQSGDIYARHIA